MNIEDMINILGDRSCLQCKYFLAEIKMCELPLLGGDYANLAPKINFVGCDDWEER